MPYIFMLSQMRQAREKAELLKEARKESDTPISDSPAAYSQGGTTALQASDMKSPIDSSSQKATPTPASDTPASRPESQSQADTADGALILGKHALRFSSCLVRPEISVQEVVPREGNSENLSALQRVR